MDGGPTMWKRTGIWSLELDSEKVPCAVLALPITPVSVLAGGPRPRRWTGKQVQRDDLTCATHYLKLSTQHTGSQVQNTGLHA